MRRQQNSSVIRFVKIGFISLLFSLALCSSSHAAYTWVTQSTTSDVYNKIVALSADRAFVVGNNGKVASTSNYGRTWTYYPWDAAGTNLNSLRDVVSRTSLEVNFAGDGSTIVTAAYNPSTATYEFTSVTPPAANITFEGCFYRPPDTPGFYDWTLVGYDILGAGGIWRHQSGGWERQLNDPTDTRYKKAYFVDDVVGYVAGTVFAGSRLEYGLQFTNDGVNWIGPPGWLVAQQGCINDFQYLSNSDIWLVGTGGFIYQNFAAWFDRSIAGGPDLYGVYFTSPTNGRVVGDGGRIYVTTNGGTAWALEQQLDTGYTLEALSFSGTTDGWIVGKSASGSKIWRYVLQPGITSVSPETIDAPENGQTKTAVITIEGDSFAAAPTVTFSGTGITSSSVQWISAAKIEVTASISSEVSEYHDVTVTNPDSGTSTEARAIRTIPSSLSIQSIKINGRATDASDNVSVTKSQNQTSINFEAIAPSSLSNFTITAEVIITPEGSSATIIQIPQTAFTTSEGSRIATMESVSLGTLEVGTITGLVRAYCAGQVASKPFVVTVSLDPAPANVAMKYSSLLPTCSVVKAGDTVTVQARVLSNAINAAKSVVIVGAGVEDVMISDVIVSPRKADLRASQVFAQADGTEIVNISFKIPEHAPRGILGFLLRDASGARISQMGRIAVGSTSN